MKKLFTLVPAAMLCLQSFALDYSNPGSNNYTNEWGKLKLVGNQLSSESGKPVQLRGWSTHGDWFRRCFQEKNDFKKMKEEGANFARIASYINEGERGGSSYGAHVDMDWIKNCVDWTAELNMYCLVDWHILKPGDPNASEYSGAKDFFRDITAYVKEKNYKHVLYEICNEPNVDEQGDPYRPDVWVKVKSYAEKVLPIISANDANAVVIVGTPQWDKALSCPMEYPISKEAQGDLNVMYTFHHYTCDQQFFRGILSGAAASIPVFATEWGVSEDDGGVKNPKVCLDDATEFLNVCNGMNLGNQVISWANWSWADKGESSGSFTNGGYSSMSFSEAGNYIRQQLKKGDNWNYSSSSPYEGGHKFDGKTDFILNVEKYDKGGQNNGYYNYDENNVCNHGATSSEGFRSGDCVDVGYTDKNNKATCLKNVGWIVNGEWLKYTIEVEKAGDYDFEVYVSDHEDYNVVAISVDGENALVGENGEELYKVCRFPQSFDGQKNDDGNNGWDTYGWKSVVPVANESNPAYSDIRNYTQVTDYKYKLRFKESGTHVLGIAFLTSNSGFGGLKLFGNSTDNVDETVADAPVIAPNPAEGGVFNVKVSENSAVKVVNSLGAVVYSANVEAGATESINLNAVPGIYFVSVTGETNAVTEKLIVK